MTVGRPELRATNGIYLLTWGEPTNVTIRIDRIVEHRDEVSGETIIRTSLPGVSPHLHQARLNLTSTPARKTLSRALTERLPLPWDDILEQACVLTLQAHRQGEPVLEAGNQPRTEAPPWLLHPLLRRGQPTLLYGPGKTGKSYIAALCGLLIQEGYPWAGLTPYPERSATCLYLDYEASHDELNVRVGALVTGLGMEQGTRLLYRRCHQPLTAEIAEIRREVVDRHVTFVVVDSLGLACGGEPETAATILPYFAALRSLNITSLTIHHIPKEAERGPYGSVYVVNMSRSAWEVKRSQEAGERRIDVGLYHRYANNGRLQSPLGLSFTFDGTDADGDPETVAVNKQSVLSIPVLAVGAPLRQRLADALSHGAKSVRDLAEETGKPESDVRVTLNRYKDTFINLTPGAEHPVWGVLSTTLQK